MSPDELQNMDDARKEREADLLNDLDFGDYCLIEQKRYGAENEQFLYKVIGKGNANHYRSVPVDANKTANTKGEVCPVLKVIQCGIDETCVETFRLSDVQINNKFITKAKVRL